MYTEKFTPRPLNNLYFSVIKGAAYLLGLN
jgi:hypothetical protein